VLVLSANSRFEYASHVTEPQTSSFKIKDVNNCSKARAHSIGLLLASATSTVYVIVHAPSLYLVVAPAS
jgi:hypothetical protein